MTEQERITAVNKGIDELCKQHGIALVPQIVSEFVNGVKTDTGIAISLRPLPNWNPPENGAHELPK